MNKITCIIIEDEPLAARILEGYIGRIPFLELSRSFEDAIDAMEYLRTEVVDLIFLDIHLPQLKGMSFLRTLSKPPGVIVTTADHSYALEGYELNIVDYLLKPFEFERFLAAVNKVNKAPLQQELQGTTSRNYLLINVHTKKVRIFFSEILYIESQKEYVKIVTESQTYTTRMSTHEIESLLPTADFGRVHRSFIVAIRKIRSYNSEEVEINGMLIPVGRGYKNALDHLFPL